MLKLAFAAALAVAALSGPALAQPTVLQPYPSGAIASPSAPSVQLPAIGSTSVPAIASMPNANISAGAASALPSAQPTLPFGAQNTGSSMAIVGGSPAAHMPVTMSDNTSVTVFGSDLFDGAFASTRPGTSSDYLIQPGDQIAVHVFGAVNSDALQVVDASGRLFVQGIGPVQVAGVPAGQLQTAVTALVQKVYTSAVGVYVSVVNGGTLGVYVAGNAVRNGRYVGNSGDSLLYFLDQAGGIDPQRGSFRNISVSRGGRVIAHYDLYDFILRGAIQPLKFEDGDVIFVAPRGPLVAAQGDVRNPDAFEAPAGAATISAQELTQLAVPFGTVTSVDVTQTSGGARTATHYTLSQLAPVRLIDSSTVTFRSEIYTQTINVSLQGDIKGQTSFVFPRGATLSQLISQLPLDGSDVAADAIHIERSSVALSQKDALNRALDTLQRAVITEPVYGSDTAAAKTAQIAAVQQYIAQARQAQPSGDVAVYTDGVFHDLRLENGDVIVLPSRTDVVLVAGEVLSPGAFSHGANLRAYDYIQSAGGFGDNANKKHVVFRHLDGSAVVVDVRARPKAGDQIVVVPDFGAGQKIGFFRDLTQIIFQIATTAAVAINVSK